MAITPKIDLEHTVSLRVHFQLQSDKTVGEILKSAFQLAENKKKSHFTTKIVDQHIWLGIAKKHQKLYSPNLHLELAENQNKNTTINAKFGPDPALWTLFMFLHFALGLASITLAIIAYANYALQKPFRLQLLLIGLIALIWIGLYVFARVNRSRGKAQAKMLLEKAKQII